MLNYELGDSEAVHQCPSHHESHVVTPKATVLRIKATLGLL